MALSLGYDNLDGPDLDVVYIPSQSIDPQEIAKLFGFVYYEVDNAFSKNYYCYIIFT